MERELSLQEIDSLENGDGPCPVAKLAAFDGEVCDVGKRTENWRTRGQEGCKNQEDADTWQRSQKSRSGGLTFSKLIQKLFFLLESIFVPLWNGHTLNR